MSESTRHQRMTPQLAPVAVVDLTVPKATVGGKSAKQGEAIEDKGKGKAEEGQDTYGCLLYTSPSPRDRQKSRMPSSA